MQTDQQKDGCHHQATVVRATKRAEEAGYMGLSSVMSKKRDEAQGRKWHELANNMTGTDTCSNPKDPKGSGPQMAIHG